MLALCTAADLIPMETLQGGKDSSNNLTPSLAEEWLAEEVNSSQ